MTKSAKKIDERQLAEARHLAELYRERNGGLTQEKFGAEYGIGTQGMVWQLLNGERPLSLKSAVGFARGLNVPLDEISPTIVEQVKDAAHLIADFMTTHPGGSQSIVECKTAAIPINEAPEYVLGVYQVIFDAWKAGVPREMFDAVRILLDQHIKSEENGKIVTRHKAEAAKKSRRPMSSIEADIDSTVQETERRLAKRDEGKHATRTTGEKRSKGLRH